MKYLPYFLICLILLCFCNYNRKESLSTFSPTKWRNDTIVNTTFYYLPDTYIMDSSLFLFASKLMDVEQIYNDSIVDAYKYKLWFKKTDSLFRAELVNRHIGIDRCFKYISDNMIPDIRKYGTNCTAALGEVAWLTFGMNLYAMFAKQEEIQKESMGDVAHWWILENDAWLEIITKLFPLIDYEICNVTGSSAAHEIPNTFSKITQSRIYGLNESVNRSDLSKTHYTESLNRLEGEINSINTLRLDWEKYELVEDSLPLSCKKEVNEALIQWIAIRSNMTKLESGETTIENSTIVILDSVSSAIFHIRH